VRRWILSPIAAVVLLGEFAIAGGPAYVAVARGHLAARYSQLLHRPGGPERNRKTLAEPMSRW